MGEFFKDWRHNSGIVSLILTFAFEGAWVKSSFDKTVICCPNGSRVDEMSMAGKIGVFCHPANVEILGLYRESLVVRLPYQSVEESCRPTPARDAVDFSFEIPPPSAMLEDTQIRSVSYEAEPTQVEKRIAISFDLDKQLVSDSDGNTYPMGSEMAKELAEAEEIDEGLTTSKWQAFGFYANWTKSRDGGWHASFLVPHGSIVIPLMLFSAYLIVSKPRSANHKKMATPI